MSKFFAGQRILPRPSFATGLYSAWAAIPYVVVANYMQCKTRGPQYTIRTAFVEARSAALGKGTRFDAAWVEENFMSEREAVQHSLEAYGKGHITAGDKAWVIAERLVQDHSAFESFEDLLSAKGDYRPTLRGSEGALLLADLYDFVQELRGDPRRAFRG